MDIYSFDGSRNLYSLKGIERCVGVCTIRLDFCYSSSASAIIFVIEDNSHLGKRLIVQVRLISEELSVKVNIPELRSHSTVYISICRKYSGKLCLRRFCHSA